MIDNQSYSFLQEIGSAANFLGFEIFIVGGAVRNELLKENFNKKIPEKQDYDLVINTNAIDFVYKFQQYYEDNHPQHRTFLIKEEFEQFKTVKISHPENPDLTIEIASARRENYLSPADFPKVELIDDIKQDLSRRDFTINALLKSLNKKDFGAIIDQVNGFSDMKNSLIRVFHNDSFIDDPTRIYRAIRLMFEFDFKLESNTEKLLRETIEHRDFLKWFKKRTNRFQIEKNNIEKLGEEKFKQAKNFLLQFNHVL